MWKKKTVPTQLLQFEMNSAMQFLNVTTHVKFCVVGFCVAIVLF